jgi:hypothetical protein
MGKVCFLVPGSPNAAFFSQIAALGLALRRLTWTRWEPTLFAVFGGDFDPAAYAAWEPHLQDIDKFFVALPRFRRDGLWAQSDDVFRFAPSDADVYVAIDADTLPVAGFEDLLDQIFEQRAVGGVMAHFPFPLYPGLTVSEAWSRAAEGITALPEFAHCHSLLDPSEPLEMRLTPFYLNFGVVFFAKPAFDLVAPRYLAIRELLMKRLPKPKFSGQVALTLAISDTGVRTMELPMRFNFPNDPIAARLHPAEALQPVIFHYLRTKEFDRQKIFTSHHEYQSFLGLQLEGVNKVFQDHVRRVAGEVFPFG